MSIRNNYKGLQIIDGHVTVNFVTQDTIELIGETIGGIHAFSCGKCPHTHIQLQFATANKDMMVSVVLNDEERDAFIEMLKNPKVPNGGLQKLENEGMHKMHS